MSPVFTFNTSTLYSGVRGSLKLSIAGCGLLRGNSSISLEAWRNRLGVRLEKTAPATVESRPQFLKRLQRTVAWLNSRQRLEADGFVGARSGGPLQSCSSAAPSASIEACAFKRPSCFLLRQCSAFERAKVWVGTEYKNKVVLTVRSLCFI